MSPHNPRAQHGFTLIETLVSMIAGIVVMGAVLEMFVVSLHQTTHLTDNVQATQIGRTAMTHVVDELHSACIAREFAPVQEKSTYSKLIFRTGYSEKTLIEPAEASEHTIAWTGSYPGSGKLTDASTKGSSGTWPNFAYAGTTTSTTLAENVYGPSLESESNKHVVFKYYKYASTASLGTTTTSSGSLEELKPSETTGLTSAQAKETAAVLVSFSTAPLNGQTALNRKAEFSNLVTLSFSTPSSEATIKDGPCQ